MTALLAFVLLFRLLIPAGYMIAPDDSGQGFEAFLVADALANFRIGKHWNAAFGVENLTNEKYYLFHPFPQRSFTAELTYRW